MAASRWIAPRVFGVEESVTVYKFGYVAWNNELIFPSYENRKSKSIPTDPARAVPGRGEPSEA